MPDLNTLGLKVENYFDIFEISTLDFTNKQKRLNLGSKILYLGILGLEF